MVPMTKICGLAAISIAICAAPGYATPTIGASEDWGGGSYQGWNNGLATTADYTGLGGIAASGGVDSAPNGNYLAISFSSGNVNPGLLYADASTHGGGFVGNYGQYGNDLTVNFQFKAFNGYSPSVFGLYFRSSGSLQEWFAPLTPPAPGSWVSYSVPFLAQNWGLLGNFGNPALFGSDIGTIDKFGIMLIEAAQPVAQNFGLDNFSLAVPEPETVWLVLAALASLGLTFRSRIGDTLKALVSRA